MFPLTTIELAEDFSLEKNLKIGFLPHIVSAPDPEEQLKSYFSTYIREEVSQEGLVRNFGSFNRFLEAASFSQGSSLNISEVSRSASVERKTVQEFFNILEDLLLAIRVPVFTKRAKRTVKSHPKFYFFDVGVYRTIRPQGPLDSPEEMDGPALETVFLQEVRAINAYLNLGYEIFYWHTSNDEEVRLCPLRQKRNFRIRD